MHGRGEDPADGIGEIERGQRVVPHKDGVDPDGAQDAGAEDRDDHRQPRFSEPAHHAAADLHCAAEEIGH